MPRYLVSRVLPWIVLAATVLSTEPVLPQSVPTLINFQGRLTDNSANQNPIDGPVGIEFRIYGSPTGNDLLWTENWPTVQVRGGVFSVLLGGGGSPIPAGLFSSGADRYLTMVVLSEGEEFQPRHRIAAGAFAMYAADAAMLGGVPGSSFARLDAAQTFLGAQAFTNPGNTFVGNGSSLTSLNASALIGRVPDGGLGGTYSSALTLNNASNSFAGSFAGTFTGSGTFSGNGSSLTGLNASALSTGVVPDGRLSGMYSSALTLNNASNFFAGSFTGTFSGNGSALTNVTAATANFAGFAAAAGALTGQEGGRTTSDGCQLLGGFGADCLGWCSTSSCAISLAPGAFPATNWVWLATYHLPQDGTLEVSAGRSVACDLENAVTLRLDIYLQDRTNFPPPSIAQSVLAATMWVSQVGTGQGYGFLSEHALPGAVFDTRSAGGLLVPGVDYAVYMRATVEAGSPSNCVFVETPVALQFTPRVDNVPIDPF